MKNSPQWQAALKNAEQSLRPQEKNSNAFPVLLEVCESPEDLILMTRLLYQATKTQPRDKAYLDEVVSLVNDSSYALSDALKALLQFTQYLEQQKRPTELPKMLYYLDCCAATESTSTLQHVLTEFLRSHGYEG